MKPTVLELVRVLVLEPPDIAALVALVALLALTTTWGSA